MKKADLIVCIDGIRVIKNLEGSNSIYYSHPEEKVLKVMTRPATQQDLNNCLSKLGIKDFGKVDAKLQKVIVDELSKIPKSKIAYGHEKGDDGKWYYNWYYEVIVESKK